MIKERIVSNRGRANVGDVVSRVTWRKIVKFPVNILEVTVEIVGRWRSVVVRNRINKAREEAIADVEENLEERETDTEDRRNVEGSDGSEDDGYYVFSASDGESTLYLL